MEPDSRLYIRLSSLGDVILASSALQALPLGVKADWLVSAEFAELFRGHPRVARLWVFDRSLGRAGWRALAEELWAAKYDEIVDLHASLRTRLLRFWFFQWRILGVFRGQSLSPRWRILGKRQCARMGYFIFRRLWPRTLRPDRVTVRSARLAGGTGEERPDFRHLLLPSKDASSAEPPEGAESLVPGRYLCVMPGSAWLGKRWPIESFIQVLDQTLKEKDLLPVVLGSAKDLESKRLVDRLSSEGRPVVSGVAKWKLSEVARVLAGSAGYFGNDTGLAHLAEAVGVPAFVLFGPTRADLGFGPWRPESVAFESPLWCSPCSKDGEACFRLGANRFLCQRKLTPGAVTERLSEALSSHEYQSSGTNSRPKSENPSE